MGNVILSTANVPEGTCPSWIIDLWPQLVALMEANLTGTQNTFNYGSSTPDPADQDKPWIKTDANGYPDGQYWVFNGGSWVKKHPLPPGSIMMWQGDIASIDTFDGGESAALTATTGPMWEQLTDSPGRFPLGAGAMVTSGSLVAPGATGGEETHELTVEELPEHDHFVENNSEGSGSVTTGNSVADRSPNTGNAYNLVGADDDADVGRSSTTGEGVGHNNIPPYFGVHFIKRTTREYYRA